MNANNKKTNTVKSQCRKDTGYVESNRRDLSDYLNSQLLKNKNTSIISDFNLLQEEVNSIRVNLQQADNDLDCIDYKGE